MKHNKRLVGLLLLAIIFGSCVCAIAIAACDTYTVKKGDCLWNISRKYCVELSDVIECNPQIDNPRLIYPGDKVSIPIDTGEKITTPKKTSKPKPAPQPTEKATPESQTPKDPTTPSGLNSMEEEVVRLTNLERTKRGLPALKINKEVSHTARLKSQDMIDRGYFSHTSPTYGSPFEMLKSFNIKYTSAGENIAYGQRTAKQVVDGWMNSQGHRANILNKSYNQIGVGYAKDKSGTPYWTQQFIRN